MNKAIISSDNGMAPDKPSPESMLIYGKYSTNPSIAEVGIFLA